MRLDGYIRVSQVSGREGMSFTSPQVQREAIEGRAKVGLHSPNGHEPIEIAKWHEELDVSGYKMNRPKLNELLERVKSGETQGIIVYKLNRFARTTSGGYKWMDDLYKKHRGVFVSCHDAVDMTTPDGRNMIRIQLSMDETMVDTSRETYANSRAGAVSRGVAISGHTPFGYRRETITELRALKKDTAYVDEHGGKLYPDENDDGTGTAPILRGIFERRAAGESWGDIGKWLRTTEAANLRIWPGAAQHMVKNEVYLGVLVDRASGARHEAAHNPLVTPEIWHAAQIRFPSKPRVVREENLLRGLVRCAGCRYCMNVNGQNFLCSRTTSCGRCPARCYAHSEDLLALVEQQLWEKLAERKVGARERAKGSSLESIDARIAEAEKDRDGWAATYAKVIAADGDEDGWLAENGRLSAIVRDLKHERSEMVDAENGTHDLLRENNLRERYTAASPEGKRDVLLRAIRHVFVRAGRNRAEPVAARMDVIFWDDPRKIEVPRKGKQGFVSSPWPIPKREVTQVAAETLAGELGVAPELVRGHAKQLGGWQRTKKSVWLFDREEGLRLGREHLENGWLYHFPEGWVDGGTLRQEMVRAGIAGSFAKKLVEQRPEALGGELLPSKRRTENPVYKPRNRYRFHLETALPLALHVRDAKRRDYVAEIEQLLNDGEWRTFKEISARPDAEKPGVGGRAEHLYSALKDHPEIFISRPWREVRPDSEAPEWLGRERAVLWSLRRERLLQFESPRSAALSAAA